MRHSSDERGTDPPMLPDLRRPAARPHYASSASSQKPRVESRSLIRCATSDRAAPVSSSQRSMHASSSLQAPLNAPVRLSLFVCSRNEQMTSRPSRTIWTKVASGKASVRACRGHRRAAGGRRRSARSRASAARAMVVCGLQIRGDVGVGVTDELHAMRRWRRSARTIVPRHPAPSRCGRGIPPAVRRDRAQCREGRARWGRRGGHRRSGPDSPPRLAAGGAAARQDARPGVALAPHRP